MSELFNFDQTHRETGEPAANADKLKVLPTVPGYEIIREIGPSGMAVVYSAKELTLRREVAIKVMLPGMDSKAFVREARIAAHLPHPGIPPVHAIGKLPDGRPYLAMKMTKGESLDQLLNQRTTLMTGRTKWLAVFEQICQAVGYAHSQRIMHSDLNPGNVMVGAFGEVQVLEWGMAKILGGTDTSSNAGSRNVSPTDFKATLDSQVKGKALYLAPEQAREEPADARADVFALGGILCLILTGRPPFKGQSAKDTINRARQADLKEINKHLDQCTAQKELIALCKKCLAPKAADRFSDAKELTTAVANYRADLESGLLQVDHEINVAKAQEPNDAKSRREVEVKKAEQRKRQFMKRFIVGSLMLWLVTAGVGVAFGTLWRRAEDSRKEALLRTAEAETQRLLAQEQRDAAEFALNQANAQKQMATDAVNDAVKAKGIAELAQAAEKTAQEQLEAKREKLAVFEYGRTMQAAHQEWRDNNLRVMRDLLDGTTPKMRNWEWRYLNRLCDPSLLTLKGHRGKVNAASFSPDGTRIVTGSGMNEKSGEAKVWDAKTGAVLLTLKGHTDIVTAASFSSDGALIVTGSYDNTAKV